MSAPAQTAQALRLCEGCERRFPARELDDLTSYCARCLRRVAAQTARSLAVLAARAGGAR